MNKERNKLLRQVAEHLILRSISPFNLGLLNGKMGVVVFFYHYSHYLKDPVYNDFADELLDEVFEEIHDLLPIDFENGYLGIGWGIEYLLKQKFVAGNAQEILEDIDKKIMERDIRRMQDTSTNTGLAGVLHYVIFRIHNNNSNKNLFDECYLSDLKDTINGVTCKPSANLAELFDSYTHWYEKNINPRYQASIFLENFYLQNAHIYKKKSIGDYLNTGFNLLK